DNVPKETDPQPSSSSARLDGVNQPTWACTVSEETNRCCWGVFHNKCIETKAAYQARNEDREGDWRCPGCQTQRTIPPGQYRYADNKASKKL
ncbi:16967_t:CDS:2, partial [Acaulospora colombiana]